ncbi:MAG TPA: glycosyltransferase family 2 protein [Candidatus Paceibacterota bacterium]
MHTPRVTVLTAAWTRAQYIGKGIQSVIDQTFQDWELIIVDDGSPDNTAQVVKEWQKKDARIKYIRLEHVGRIAVVSNAGLKEAKGEYVAILDDDDHWIDPKKMEKQVAFLDAHKDYVGCGSFFVIVDKDDNEGSRVTKPQTDDAIRKVALYANPIANSTSIFRRSVAAQFGYYDESLRQFADWDFWLKMGKYGKLCNMPEYFLAYRMWDKGSSFMNQRQNVDAAFVIIRRHKDEYPGYFFAYLSTTVYWLYARLPVYVRKRLNAFLSRLKKALFS